MIPTGPRNQENFGHMIVSGLEISGFAPQFASENQTFWHLFLIKFMHALAISTVVVPIHEFHCDGITLGTLFFTDQLIFDLFIICLSETKFAQYFRCVSCLLGSTNWVNMLTNFRAGTRHISRDGITLR